MTSDHICHITGISSCHWRFLHQSYWQTACGIRRTSLRAEGHRVHVLNSAKFAAQPYRSLGAVYHPPIAAFVERGAFHPVGKRIASFHTLATLSKQTLACPTLAYLATILCDLESPECKAMRLGLRITGILPNSYPLVGPHAGYIETGPVSRPDCACVHLDGQTFSYYGISYHSVCTMSDQPFYTKGPRPLL